MKKSRLNNGSLTIIYYCYILDKKLQKAVSNFMISTGENDRYGCYYNITIDCKCGKKHKISSN